MAAATMTQTNVAAPFFYYSPPNSKADSRSHALFSPHPRGASSNATHTGQRQSQPPSLSGYSAAMHSPKHLLSQTPNFTRPAAQGMTMASPRPIGQKPTIVIQNEAGSRGSFRRVGGGDGDFYLSPSTPPLSMSGSAIGSPLSAGGSLLTPHDTTVFVRPDLTAEDVKHDFEEFNAHLSWGYSPPMTPHWPHPSSVAPSHMSDLLSAQACPSLSPSPSPLSALPKVEYNPDLPRHVSIPLDYPLLPTLCAGDDEEHKMILRDELQSMMHHEDATTVTTMTMSPLRAATVTHGLPTFDELDASEDDGMPTFATFAPPTENAHFLGAKRQRTEMVSVDEPTSFTGDLESDLIVPGYAPSTFTLPTPPDSDASRRCSEYSCESQSAASNVEVNVVEDASYPSAPASFRSFSESGASTSESGDHSASTEDGDSNVSDETRTSPPRTHVSRRGRKQSLTEDPSKTFVCDLCSRRFRRQEHLKRHYRSLHTQEKPFECGECGKKFSRSDNLAQHARTHGSGAIVMGVLENGEIPLDATVLAAHGMHDASDGLQMFEPRLYEATCQASTPPLLEALDFNTASLTSLVDDASSRRKRRRVD
ncbi:MAG: hypothetical protein M1823_002773 [Watsoniomyces obsoletus]|nr:MAG: hypothetical protein M1823_002773 [Watsoniomyces obsoletus]